MKVVADLQIHSRFARAVSPRMTLPVISQWATKKGIDLVATGDWTHPIWYRELVTNLEEASEGVYKLKGSQNNKALFLLSTEVSSIYSQGGKVRRVHTLIFAPSLNVVEKINKELTLRGANLLSDGRPIVGLSAKQVAEITLTIDKRCLVVPAHCWTPHFSLFGSMSGFDSIEECFGGLSSNIYAVESGLSSDPAMNWRIEELSTRSIVSFSDAHSPEKLGREATVFELSEITFANVRKAIIQDGKEKIDYTIEFYPEEGKYHFTGHRNCKVVYSPNDLRKMGLSCPVCGRALTVGVMSRVEHLASIDVETKAHFDKFRVRWIKDKADKRPKYAMLVPLLEIIAECLNSTVGSQKVMNLYEVLVNTFGSEFKTLLEIQLIEIERIAGPKLAEGISKVRSGDIVIEPGYDGVFGKVKIWPLSVLPSGTSGDQSAINQASLF